MLQIVLMSMAAASVYGVLHDQITARICVEYFTLAHPPLFDTDDPTLLGLGWGVVATWWVGLILGLLLAFAARVGSRPKRDAASLVVPLFRLGAITAFSALLAAMLAWSLGRDEAIVFALIGPLAPNVSHELVAAFVAVAAAHLASYGVGVIGGIVVIVQTWRSRRMMNERQSAGAQEPRTQ